MHYGKSEMALTTILLELNWILNQRERNVERNWILSTKTTKPTENKVFSKASSYYVSKKILQSHFFLKKICTLFNHADHVVHN